MSLTEFFVTSTFSSKLYRVIFEFQPVIDLYKLFTYGRWYMFFCFHVFYSFINLYFQIICIVSHQISNQYFCSIVFGYWMEFSFIIEKFNSATKFMLYICLCISKKNSHRQSKLQRDDPATMQIWTSRIYTKATNRVRNIPKSTEIKLYLKLIKARASYCFHNLIM